MSVGGTTGLFVGASLLSFVELLFYFTVRFIINIWLEKQKQKQKNRVTQYRPTASEIDDSNILAKRRDDEIKNAPYADSGVLKYKFIL